MSDYDDVELMQFADGALDAGRAQRIRAAAALDPALRARIESFVASRRVLGRAFDEVLERPLPTALRDTVLGMPAARPSAQRRRARAPLRWALAASLMAALALGWYAQRPAPPALLALAAPALERGASGSVQSLQTPQGVVEVLPLASYRADDGRYCRDFRAHRVEPAQDSAQGRACRSDDGSWEAVRIAAAPRADETAFVPAAGAPDAAPALHRLDAAQEAQALASGWRR